jgi:WD40 repeat protein
MHLCSLDRKAPVLNTINFQYNVAAHPKQYTLQTLEEHEEGVSTIAVIPDKRRTVTTSYDKTLRLWDLETVVVLKKIEALAVSCDGNNSKR